MSIGVILFNDSHFGSLLLLLQLKNSEVHNKWWRKKATIGTFFVLVTYLVRDSTEKENFHVLHNKLACKYWHQLYSTQKLNFTIQYNTVSLDDSKN